MVITNAIFYTSLFIGIYIQVFFFLTLIQDRRRLRTGQLAADDELPEVTFLVPCWNEGQTITGTIESLRKLDYPQAKLHMVVIDDGSTDDTWEVLQQYKDDSDITLVHQENGGKTSALITGLPLVTTDWMCSIDADTFLEEQALRRIMTYAIRRPQLSAVGGSIMIHKPKTLAQSAQSVDYQMFSFSKKMLGLLGGVLVAPGAFSVYKTADLQAAGSYREAHGLEDLELTFRLQEQGYKVDHCHNAIAHTTGPDTLRALFKQRLRWSYGMLNNAYDYRHMVFNRKFGVFGMFTIPMGLISYFIIIYMFLISWYFLFRQLIDTIIQVRIQGIDSLWGGIDLFFFGTKPLALLAIVMYVFIILTIVVGRWLSGVKTRDYYRVPIFILVYGILVPFWVLRSTANFFLAKRPAWR